MATPKKPKCPISVHQAKSKKTGEPILKWYHKTTAKNGEDLATSQLYSSKSNAVRGKDDILDLIEKYLISVGRVVSTVLPTQHSKNGDVAL